MNTIKQFKDLNNEEIKVVIEKIMFEVEHNKNYSKPIYSFRKIVEDFGFSYEQLLDWYNDDTRESIEGFDLEECHYKCVREAHDELWQIVHREWFNFCERNELENLDDADELYEMMFA